ncbi:MAG: histidine--tRNA ligase [Acidimicrobiia bacterium]|nr:histidine--tRNA ligase [Acidimicrobiia bacterium]MDH5504181.1 histidine--tRNA ligase [Acidimicrobiia bacterium]
MSLRAPKGTDDILPPASRVWRRLLNAWEQMAEVYGYDLIMVPLFEMTEVFSRGVGESSEVVQKQMYTFDDKGGRSLTLRPEGTAGVVRAFVQAGAQGVMKVSYSGAMFRYERPQAGRRRQFFQVGLEYLGSPDPDADAEVIELGYRYLTSMGVPDVVVRLNSLGDGECRPAYVELLRSWLEERRSLLCADSQQTLDLNPMRVLDCKVCAEIVAGAPSPVDSLCDACEAHFGAVQQRLISEGVRYTLDPQLVRGLDYYTRTAFEYVGSALDTAQTALGGGGRYDGLAELLGGPPVPGVGLALGVDRIVLSIPDAELPAIDVFVANTDTRRAEALRILGDLRSSGIKSDSLPDQRSLKAQFKAADRRGARAVVVVGDEWETGQVVIKRLDDGSQETIAREEIATWLKSH